MATNKLNDKIVEAKATVVGPKDPPEPKNNVLAVRKDSAEGLIAQAIEKGTPVETMERLLAMRRELKAEYAKEQFDKDMAGFQGECPVINKTKQARDESKGKNLYKYAPLDSIVEQTKELIKRYGFSYSFKTVNNPERVSVTCIVKHKDGHAEESTMETSLATRTQIMSGPQQIASTVTFNKRYAFCNAFGIMTGDEDTDAQDVDNNSAGKSKLVESARAMIGKATVEQLEDYKKKIGGSPKYTPEQKVELTGMIDNRIRELTSNKN